jgi:hypothetical protein
MKCQRCSQRFNPGDEIPGLPYDHPGRRLCHVCLPRPPAHKIVRPEPPAERQLSGPEIAVRALLRLANWGDR